MNEAIKKSSQIVCAMMLALSVYAVPIDAEAAQDPGGWQQFKWGMSYQQVMSMSQGRDTKSLSDDDRLRLGTEIEANVVVDSYAAVAHFYIGCGDIGLMGIELTFSVQEGQKSPLYDLVDQYGYPIQEDLPKNIWNFPSTTMWFEGHTAAESDTGQPYSSLDYLWTKFKGMGSDKDYCRARGINLEGSHGY